MAEQHDAVRNPAHYVLIDGVESITIIASAMTAEQWKGFCLGNIIKYRLRAGKKDAMAQDIGKAAYYEELYATHLCYCRDGTA
ncbi:MAG: DUF3310 domain-containing protein [Porticoccaceae bacterium]|nr:DUF3310 domain-containing protein [Porticoccaceae bacterium]